MTIKLLVFSDSHGNTARMVDLVRMECPDAIIHLGDVAQDMQSLAAQYPHVPRYSVAGNCDGFSNLPKERIVAIEGKRILMMHGHTRAVKSGVGNAVLAAQEAEVHILLYGHTHRSHCECHHGMWLLNPGSIGGADGGTYGVITIENGKITCYTSTAS